jgi:SAM-dependent methyltransferase
MDWQVSDRVWRVLRCPNCGGALERQRSGASCAGCNCVYPAVPGAGIDLRLQQPKTVHLDFVLEEPPPPPRDTFQRLLPASSPEVDFDGVDVPRHLTRELMSYFPRGGTDKLILDLGCGAGIHRAVCEHAGFEYVGLDYTTREAMIIGDAHALPFAADSFDSILSIAVLEHIRFPFVMMRETFRVLKPGGRFIGTVAFLEPFHGNSFYHHTHLGTLNTLSYAGFCVEHIAPSKQWSVLVAQAQMGLFPKMPQVLARGIVMPIQWVHVLWWNLGRLLSPKADELTRMTNHTGAFTFIAAKSANGQ